jgi:hypothetical protein
MGTLLILCLHLSHLLFLFLLLPNLGIEFVLFALMLQKGPLFVLDPLYFKLKRGFWEGSSRVVNTATILNILLRICLFN